MTDDEREMVFELATALSGAVVVQYEPEDFRDSPIIDRIAQVAAHDERPRLGSAAHHSRGAPEGVGSRAGDRNSVN